MKSMNTKMTELAWDRQEEVGKFIIKDKEYNRLSEDLNSLFDEIICLLPENKQHLIHKFDEQSTEQSSIREAALYKQGLRDGIQLSVFTLDDCI